MVRRLLRVLSLALGLTLLLAVPEARAAGGMVLAYDIITTTQVAELWRKVQGALQQAYNFMTPEFNWISNRFPQLNIDASLREMTFPIDIYEDRGVASIPEGGRLAEPMTVGAEDATIVFTHYNKRFTLSYLTRWAERADGGRGVIVNQMKQRGRKATQATARVLGDSFYGYSNGVLAENQTDLTGSSGTYTLANAYGDTDIPGGNTAENSYIANLFKVGEFVALIRAGALVTNARGQITDVDPATPSIDVTWAGSVDADVGDQVVLANSTDATLLTQTSWNHNLVGLLEMLKAQSVHGIDSTTVPNWSAAFSDTNAGRFTGPKWRHGVDEIQNFGQADASVITLMAKGVNRDVISQYAAGVRFPSMMSMEIDGDFTARGNHPLMSRRMPPGMVCIYGRQAIKRKTIFDDVEDMPSFGNAKFLTDDAGWVLENNWSGLMAVTNRKLLAYWINQEEL